MSTGSGLWRRLASSVVVVVIAAAVLSAIVFLVARPPRQLAIASGPDGGMYHRFAEQLRAQLARRGFTLKVLTTDGSVDNVGLITSGGADIGIVQSGTDTFTDMSHMTAISELFYEPIWVFYRSALGQLESIEDLTGLRLSIGPVGSGVNALASSFLERAQIMPSATLALTNDEAIAGLRAGTLDAAAFVVSPSAPLVAELADIPGLAILDQPKADAYARRIPYLTPVTLSRGVIDIVDEVPPVDIRLLAATATLVGGDDLNPDLARLVVEAIPAALPYPLVGDPRRFPTLVRTTLPANEDARRYLAEGPTPLERILPFEIASPLSRLYLVMLPLVVLIFPLWAVIKSAYNWWMFGRIGNYYPRIHDIERNLGRFTLPQLDEQLEYLRDLDEKLPDRTRVTTGYLPRYFDLRTHIAFVERQVEARRAALLATPEQDQGAPPASATQAGMDAPMSVDPGPIRATPTSASGQVSPPGP